MTPQDVNRDYNLMNANVVTPEEIRRANVRCATGGSLRSKKAPAR